MSSNSARRRPLVIGNWKMNGDIAMAEHLLASLRDALAPSLLERVDVAVCPPFPYLGLAAARLAGSRLAWGAQDVCAFDNGAFTGEVSAAMLADLGCGWALVGHSERRTLFGDTDEAVARKAAQAIAAGVVPVICVGETLAEREAGQAERVLARQVDAVLPVLDAAQRQTGGGAGRGRGAERVAERFVFAYEPVWAIGTGRTATPAQAQEIHALVRQRVARAGVADAGALRILYGGSVKPSNASELFGQADVDGGLIGGAALVAEDFVQVCAAAQA
jgi:triosephosphate isomerase (TIM)